MMQKTYNEIFEATYSADQIKNLQQNPATSSELFNMTDIFIRRLIKFAKCIPEFKELKQEDQINLLKVFIYKDFHHSDMSEQEWLQSALSGGCVGQKDVETSTANPAWFKQRLLAHHKHKFNKIMEHKSSMLM